MLPVINEPIRIIIDIVRSTNIIAIFRLRLLNIVYAPK